MNLWLSTVPHDDFTLKTVNKYVTICECEESFKESCQEIEWIVSSDIDVVSG